MARGLAYIASSNAPRPSDQTDLDTRCRFILKGGGGRIVRLDLIGPRRWTGAHMDRAGALPMWPTGLWSGLVSFGVF
jgi:hypothetical protein